MVSSVSQSIIIWYDAVVPSSPIDPVTHGRSSESTSLPSSAFAAPAPSRSATCVSSASAPPRALPDEQRHLLPRVQDLGRLCDRIVIGSLRCPTPYRRSTEPA